MYSSIARSYFDEFPFGRNDRRRPSSGYFFLSHAHSDHTRGLKNIITAQDSTVVCTRETAAVIKALHRIPREKCLIVKPSQSLDFDDFKVHCLDANHCLGSLMFVIEDNDGTKEVYTGDFRLGSVIIEEMELLRNPDHLYVDYVYGRDPKYDFPSRKELISDILTLIHAPGNYPERNVWLSAYQIGKEILFQTISKAIGKKIWAPPQKIEIFKEIGGEWDIFTDNDDVQVFVGSRRMVENLQGIDNSLHPKISDALRISPTGWAIKLAHKRLDVHFFPYSDHCSFSELHTFIREVNPKRITKLGI
ncbi:MAG: MBL fold metallo-hydrolase [Candidatus Thorarchaeota archaeon]